MVEVLIAKSAAAQVLAADGFATNSKCRSRQKERKLMRNFLVWDDVADTTGQSFKDLPALFGT